MTWRSIDQIGAGLLAGLNRTFVSAQQRDPGTFPDFSSSPAILIFSDYSGSHAKSGHDTYSYFVTTPMGVAGWEPHRVSLRLKLGLERTISFKALNDKKRWAVLGDFLSSVGNIHGLSVSFVVAKSTQSLFASASGDKEPEWLADLSPRSAERVLRITHLLGFLIAGLASPMQNIVWISDEDEIAANHDRLGQLTQLLANVSSHLVGFSLGHLRCGTSANDSADRQLEDLVAIPDLVAGALSEVVMKGGLINSSIITPPPQASSSRARAIMNWLSDSRLPVRRFVVRVEGRGFPSPISISRIRFHGASGPAV